MDKRLMGEFETSLNQIIGLECWGVVAGSGTGSIVDIQLGGRVRLHKRLRNSKLTDEQREFEPEFSIFIECVWRLDSESTIICGAWDDNREGGEMIVGLRQIVGSVISSVQLSIPAFDVLVGFSNGLTLKVFCDRINLTDADDNYSLFTPSMCYTVGTRSALRREQRKVG